MPVALLSTSNKIGLIEFASGLEASGWKILATGGTSAILKNSGITVEEISHYTGSPEVLDGRVKTLHPMVFAGILSRRTKKDDDDLSGLDALSIELVAVNLYPFDETIQKSNTTFQDAIENIDIGGVSLIRAAAKKP